MRMGYGDSSPWALRDHYCDTGYRHLTTRPLVATAQTPEDLGNTARRRARDYKEAFTG